MLEGIAFIAIVTAAITSTFVARAEHLQDVAAAEDDAATREAGIQANFADVTERLERVETMLRSLTHADPADAGPGQRPLT